MSSRESDGGKRETNMNVNIGDKVKIEATVVDYNEGAKTVKLRIEGLQEDNYTPAERYIRMQNADCEKSIKHLKAKQNVRTIRLRRSCT